jgi:hypothetical protein
MEADNGFNMGRASEINRDELKFNKFTNRLQKKFARVFIDILRTQLVLKEIINAEEYDSTVKEFVQFQFATDNHFTELKDAEILKERIDTLGQVSEYVGQYYSKDWVRKYVLMQSDEDIKLIDKQINTEKDEGGDEDNDDFGGF